MLISKTQLVKLIFLKKLANLTKYGLNYVGSILDKKEDIIILIKIVDLFTSRYNDPITQNFPFQNSNKGEEFVNERNS